MKLKHKITTTFDNSVTYTSSTGHDLKSEIRTLDMENNRQANEFKIERL